MRFQTIETGVPRRAWLLMPAAFLGLYAVFYRREHGIPEAPRGGERLVLSEAEWRRRLTSMEFGITRRGGTEFAFTGRYWDNHEAGIYRCVCCGAVLFRSEEKFDSGTGWPSFWAAAATDAVYTRGDDSLWGHRTEVLCARCDAHLGHVFEDGPAPTGLRYCINSAALRFIGR